MLWPGMLFNLCVGLLLAAYLLRRVRRFAHRADELMARIDREHEARMARSDRFRDECLREYDTAREEIRASMRAQVNAAIANMQAGTDPSRATSPDERSVGVRGPTTPAVGLAPPKLAAETPTTDETAPPSLAQQAAIRPIGSRQVGSTKSKPSRVPNSPDWWLMFTQFLKQGRTIASFAPSSRFMARKLIGGIDWDLARCIVELGAGTGPTTAEIVKHLKPHTKLLVIEMDKDIAARLKEQFPGVDVVQGDAGRFDELLAERGITQVDHVVSGLPLPSFPAALRDLILSKSAKILAPEGTFRQLTVMPWVYYNKRMYRGYFKSIRVKFAPIHMPPGGVYICHGYREKASDAELTTNAHMITTNQEGRP